MSAARVWGIATAAIVLVIDQILKYFVANTLGLQSRGVIRLVPSFDLRWAENYGVSMGLLTADSDAQRWMLVGLTGALAAAVLIWMFRERLRGDIVALGLILGGALGNIIDRVRFGYVVDYADLHFGEWRPFFIFNLADACITIGVLILLARALLMREKPVATKEPADA